MSDIDQIICEVRSSLPGVLYRQLAVAHAADDDGIWYFCLPGGATEVQIESSTGNCPFLIEHDASNERFMATSVSEASAKVVELLQLS